MEDTATGCIQVTSENATVRQVQEKILPGTVREPWREGREDRMWAHSSFSLLFHCPLPRDYDRLSFAL